MIALLAVLAVAPSSALATVPGGNGRLAFAARGETGINQDIYSANPDGSDQRRLTTDPAHDWHPAWSPDGSKLAFASERDGDFEIFRMNANGTAPVALTSDDAPDLQPAWSPDGERIAFVRLEPKPFAGYCEQIEASSAAIYTIKADGTELTRLSQQEYCPGETTPEWSPDGTKIAFATGNPDCCGPANAIHVMNADGSGRTRLTAPSSVTHSPSWSPDGSRIAFTRDGGVYTVNADGSGERRITNGQAPAWSPDGTRIAVQRALVPSSLFTVNPDGGDLQNVTTTAPDDRDPSWQSLPKGAIPSSFAVSPTVTRSRAITVEYVVSSATEVATVELWVKEPGAASYALAATDSSPSTATFDYSTTGADGVYRFYTRARAVAGEYEAAPLDADSETLLDTSPPVSRASGPSRTTSTLFEVAYTVAEPEPGSGLERVELWIRRPAESAYSPFAADDDPSSTGSFRFEAPSRPGQYDFYTVAIDAIGNSEPAPAGADVRTLLVDPGTPAEGTVAIASSLGGNFDIYTVNADGSGWRKRLTDEGGADMDPAWSPTGSKLAFSTNRDGDREIYSMKADGSDETRLTDNSAADFDPAWSPDGRRIAFTSDRDGHRELYVMNANGTNPIRLTHNEPYDPCRPPPHSCVRQPTASEPSWSPDGSRIVFRQGSGHDSFGVRIARLDGTIESGGAGDSYPDWSLDNRIAGSLTYDRPDGIVYRVFGAKEQTALLAREDAVHPSWSPRGDAIAFSRELPGDHLAGRNSDVFRIADDGSDLRQLTLHRSWDRDPDWRPVRYRNVKRFCDAQRAQIGADPFARLYGADGIKGKKSADRACRKSHRG